MIGIQVVLGLLVLAGWCYWLYVAQATYTFFRRRPKLPQGFSPPASILKPVKGVDASALENFASFCRQDYPDYELVFGVSDSQDPVVPVIERLQHEFPERSIRLIIARPEGTNPKSGMLEHLAREARHELLVISDSDVRVEPDYLRRVVAPLADPQTGLVTCLYRGDRPRTLAASLESLYVETTFLPQAIVAANMPGPRFAFGATIALRKAELERIGGYRAIADYLADDYQVGVRVGELGHRVFLSRCVVSIVLGATRFADYWDREVRWARAIRVSRPRHYPGLLATYTIALALVLVAVAQGAAWAWAVLAVSIALRLTAGWSMCRALGSAELRKLVCLPLADVLGAAVWFAAIVGRQIVWRGRRFALLSDGRLEPVKAKPLFLSRVVRAIDGWLRSRQHIREYSQDPQCLLRLAVCPAKESVRLADGTSLEAGEPIGDLHLWNEHLPAISARGPSLSFGIAVRRRLQRSLEQLAERVSADKTLAGIKAFHGEFAFCAGAGKRRGRSLAEQLGFELTQVHGSRGAWRRFVEFWERLYHAALVYAYNPGGLRDDWMKRERHEFWISRESLLERFGHSA